MDEAPETPNAESPTATYNRLLQQNRDRLTLQKKRDRYLGYAKVALGFLIALFLVWYLHELRAIWPLPVGVAVFAVLAIMHERVLKRIRAIESIIGYYERGVARLEGRWAGTGESGDRFMDDLHPYARDLDLFGKGSVFELLCTFRTRAGEETLARWLLKPAQPDEIRARQAAARELKTRIRFREKLFTAGDKVRLGLHPDPLAAWGERESSFRSPWLPWLMAALAVLWVAALVYSVARSSYTSLLVVCLLNLIVNSRIMKRLAESVEAVEAATSDLDLLAGVLKILEQEHFESPRLVDLQSALKAGEIAPSAAVSKLDRIVHYLDQRRNPLLRTFGLDAFVFFTARLMFRAESWRKQFGPAIRGWLAAVGEIEVLAAFSGYAFEHSGDAWPEFEDGRACFDAASLAHPLLPEDKAVPNDLVLGDGLQLIILSGPNMSGKSTFVRGIGVNAVLAQCGAPVRAKRLRMSCLALGASICVLDSLKGGVSRFYAEIKRLKLISDSAEGPIPVLFLLDELLSGTNSHDRLAGTRLVVNALVERGAVGLVTTHDLALAQIPESMHGRAGNFHFEDHLENGELAFDFILKPGVVRTSNALKLMQSIGLVTSLSP
jgi:hypothetical protein